MAGAILVGSNTSTNNTSTDEKSITDNPPERRAFFAIVGILSILCNGALCIVVVRKRRMLKNSYNVFVLILAVMDTITGFFIVASPSFVIGNELMPIPPGVQGRIFCIVLQKNFFVWYLAKCSISVVMCMAIERWYALVHPHKYKRVFTARKVVIYAILITVSMLVVCLPTFYTTYVKNKGSKNICVSKTVFEETLPHQLYIIFYCTITAFIPCLVIVISYIHLRCSVVGQQQSNETRAQKRRRQLETSLSRMNAITAFVLSICIFPSQVTLILFNFHLISWDVVNLWSTMSTINSVMNPWIYCLTNKVYRKEFARLLCLCKRGIVNPMDFSLQDQNNTDYVDEKTSQRIQSTIVADYKK